MQLAFWKKKKDPNKKKKPVWREWFDAALFAIVAATIIRTFFIEAYTIPTGSMEGSMLINDFLFVSKTAYGPRVPNTPLAFPLVHNTMPLTGGKSYTEAVHWNYKRLPGFGNVKRNDVVVFNFPDGDTVVAERPNEDYYDICLAEGGSAAVKSTYTIITRPVDKKENYIKRCVAIPGDKVQIVNGQLYLNDKPAEVFPHSQMHYIVTTKGLGLSSDFLDENGISLREAAGNKYRLNIPFDKVDLVRGNASVVSVEPDVAAPSAYELNIFPKDVEHFKWNRDNFGPIVIPAKGATVTLTPENIALYRRVIFNYEGNAFEDRGGRFFINGKETNTYTFKMDYYWMMGDNRHESADSRYFGFVPEDHIVGKASFVWLSYEGSLLHLRWKRLLRSVSSLSK
ncbi:signal peptidase I [Rurimicrobium arvi]|uniref:Signal peptidase I n=1 Tax=Rurimicrobium arvi TaxID=2049916 RepID=A0ABP8MGX4_9BACT